MQQIITWGSVDPNLCPPMESLGHNELTKQRSNIRLPGTDITPIISVLGILWAVQ